MGLEELSLKIQQRTARIAVIGLGYVGLPVAALFADAGFDVLGVELRVERVEKINSGQSPIEGDEPGLADLIDRVSQTGRLRATSNYEELRGRDIILIDVETPVDENHIPRYEALRSALSSLGKVIQPGSLVIVESTIAPSTMQQVVWPLMERSSGYHLNEGFYLGNCPERVMPGKLIYNLRHLSRVVGGSSPETAQVMVELYSQVVKADLDPADWITAELVKTVENAYRDVQIAFANEVAQICEAIGGDVWKVRELVNKTPYRNMHLPGAGVGGHCIPKDPWLLAYSVQDHRLPLHLIPAARGINDRMPGHVAEILRSELKEMNVPMAEARILILGYAYLENSDDVRNSPSEVLVDRLQQMGVDVSVHDPYVDGYQGDIYQKAKNCHAVVFMVKHQEYSRIDFEQLKRQLQFALLVDGRGMLPAERLHAMGFQVKTIGVGSALPGSESQQSGRPMEG